MFPPAALPIPGEVLLITDELLAPADFMIHRFVAGHLKESKDASCVLVSVSEDVARWKAIASRTNVNLSAHLDSGNVSVVDVMSYLAPDVEDAQQGFKVLHGQIKQRLSSLSGSNCMVILDDLASLEWIGVAVEEIVLFVRALCALCRQLKVSLVIRLHVLQSGESDELFKRSLQLCAYHLDVFPLSSGRSGSVSGQIALHCGFTTSIPAHRMVPRSTAVHYRLTESGSMFFDRGTSKGVL